MAIRRGVRTIKTQATVDVARVIPALKKQVVSLGQLHYSSKKEVNFKEWEQRTLYLISACFGEIGRYEDVERAIAEMPEKNDTSGYGSGARYKYWLEGGDEEITDEDGEEEGKGILNKEAWDADYKKAKGWIQKQLKLCIEELELRTIDEPKPSSRGSKNVLVANQTTNVHVDIKNEIKNVIRYIHENEPNPERAKEAEQKVRELGEELERDTTKWSTVKDIVVWIANFSKDLFIQVLPILLQHYGK